MDKKQLRLDLQGKLLAIEETQRAKKSISACDKLIETPQFKNASVVMMFLSLPHEVDTAEAILHAWQQGKTVAVPKVSWQQRRMIPVEIHTLETEFTTETAGLRNPLMGVPLPYENIDLVVIPGLAFDRKGNRLGRGGSYYDGFLAHQQLKAVKCGLAFDEQIVDSIPVEDHDVPVDSLVTDSQYIVFNDGQGD
jgi:5-formyltetrahydrofolate cyclo-ligase